MNEVHLWKFKIRIESRKGTYFGVTKAKTEEEAKDNIKESIINESD